MDINIYFGSAITPFVADEQQKLSSKVQNLRKELKDNHNIDMPLVNLMDKLDFSPYEITMEIDGNTAWKQDFEGSPNLYSIVDIIVDTLKNKIS